MPPTHKQCATTAITAVHAASTMFAMDAMLERQATQLKMPRLDAYGAGDDCPQAMAESLAPSASNARACSAWRRSWM